jgi:hypothetical protein
MRIVRAFLGVGVDLRPESMLAELLPRKGWWPLLFRVGMVGRSRARSTTPVPRLTKAKI